MAGNNNDWTDELRDLIEGVELTPSEGGWDRLKADLHPRRAAWWPYAVPAAACLLLGGVFLFREQPSENEIDVLASESLAIVADVPTMTVGEMSETVPSSIAEEGRPLAVEFAKQLSAVTPSAAGPLKDASANSLRSEEISETEPFMATGESLAVELTEQTSSGLSTVTGAKPFMPEEPVKPSLDTPVPALDFESEPVIQQRKQRRKISVTVSAGGMFGSAGNGIYIAQASPAGPVTKAEAGRVLDITEVIRHSTPVQKALGLSIPISEKMDIGIGIDHMELSSIVGPGSQNLEWLGLPLRLGYNVVQWGPSSINLGAGFKREKCLSATLLGMDYNEPVQWAANMGADLRVRLFGPVSFSLEPELSYYFTETVLPTYRTGHPLTFTLHAGLSLNL